MAARMGVSLRAYQNYETHERQPKAIDVANLVGYGVNLNWLLSGMGDPFQEDAGRAPLTEIDGGLMGLALEGLKKLYAEESARLDDRSAGELATRVYAETLEKCEDSDDPDDRRAALQLVLSKLRRDLRSTDTTTQSKR